MRQSHGVVYVSLRVWIEAAFDHVAVPLGPYSYPRRQRTISWRFTCSLILALLLPRPPLRPFPRVLELMRPRWGPQPYHMTSNVALLGSSHAAGSHWGGCQPCRKLGVGLQPGYKSSNAASQWVRLQLCHKSSNVASLGLAMSLLGLCTVVAWLLAGPWRGYCRVVRWLLRCSCGGAL